MSALQALVAALGGGAAGAVQGIQMNRQRKDEEAERTEAKRRFDLQTSQLDRQFAALQKNVRDGHVANSYGMRDPNADLTGDPMLDEFEALGLPVVRAAPKAAPKLSNTMTLPSMPTHGIGARPGETPDSGTPTATEGKYDPTTASDPMDNDRGTPAMSAMTVATPTYGLGAPGKVTRQKTRPETLQDMARERLEQALNRPGISTSERFMITQALAAMGGADVNTPPTLREGPVSGGRQSLYDPIGGEVRATLDAAPNAPAPDFDFTVAFEIANGKPFDATTATAAEKAAAVAEQTRQKLAGQRTPSSSGGLNDRNITAAYQTFLRRLDGRKEVKDLREMDRYVGIMDSALAEANSGNVDSLIAVDQALINAYNKMIAPDSVVMPSEYARTASDQAILSRVRGKIGEDGQWLRGGAGLTSVERNALARLSHEFVRKAEQKALDAREDLIIEADQIGDGQVGNMLRSAWKPRSGATASPNDKVKVQAPDGTEREYDRATAERLVAANPGLKIIGGQ